ncbi:hypothetical protein HDV01_004361 [Terramyces sp. JEL0728]|nr:hypothetical protein HDV01_004361 [Terramyces sp. JEL0728]
MYACLDVIPRIISLAMYQDTVHPNGICSLLDPNSPRIIKTVMNTIYIGIVGCYFIYRMIQVISGVAASQQLESLTVTSGIYAIMLCVTRTVFYIPYILNTWPSITGILIPIQLCILPPLCFLNIIYGSKLKLRTGLTNKSRSRSTLQNDDISLCTLYEPTSARLIKTVMNTVYIAIVACYFIYKMVQLIRHIGTNSQQFESLSITSTAFAIMLCVTRTVFYIPYILNSWPSITGILVPIQMCILPPLCFLNIAYGSKLKFRSAKSGNLETQSSKTEDVNTSTKKVQNYK